MAAFDLPAYGIHLKAIVDGLDKEIAAGKKFSPVMIHEPVGMERDHNDSIFGFAFIFKGFKMCLFFSPCHNTVPVSAELFCELSQGAQFPNGLRSAFALGIGIGLGNVKGF